MNVHKQFVGETLIETDCENEKTTVTTGDLVSVFGGLGHATDQVVMLQQHIARLKAGYQWLADLAEDEGGIAINNERGEIDICQEMHGRHTLAVHTDLADLCTREAANAAS